jgi:hypothetical protein
MKQGAEFLTYKGVLFSSTIYALASPSFDPYVSTVALFHVFEMARKRDLSIIVEEGSASARTSNEVTKVFDGLVISKLRNLAEALLITRTYCNIVIPK